MKKGISSWVAFRVVIDHLDGYRKKQIPISKELRLKGYTKIPDFMTTAAEDDRRQLIEALLANDAYWDALPAYVPETVGRQLVHIAEFIPRTDPNTRMTESESYRRIDLARCARKGRIPPELAGREEEITLIVRGTAKANLRARLQETFAIECGDSPTVR